MSKNLIIFVKRSFELVSRKFKKSEQSLCKCSAYARMHTLVCARRYMCMYLLLFDFNEGSIETSKWLSPHLVLSDDLNDSPVITK